MFLDVMQVIHHWDTRGDMRTAYKKIQKGMNTNSNLSQDRIERLEEIGFQWQVLTDYFDKTFKKRCRELVAFKGEFGYCNVPRSYADDPSLGHWCGNMGTAYNNIQKGMKPNSNLSQGRIESRRYWLPMAGLDRLRQIIPEALSRADSIQRGVWRMQCSSKVCDESIIGTLV